MINKHFILCRNFTETLKTITKEEVAAKLFKHNMNTVTMGFPDLYGRFIGKKYDPDYFTDVRINSNL
jgi:hypothetical protein